MPERQLFGTSGIRGHAENFLTTQFIFDITQAFIQFLKKHDGMGPLAVGFDPRPSSPRIKQDVLKGLSTAGVPLFDEGITPIPSMNWLIKNTEVKAGIMVTGSHIDIELNGLKFYAHEEEISRADSEEIEKIYHEIKGKTPIPNEEPNVTSEDRAKNLYGQMLINMRQFENPRWKVGLDTANGGQTVLMPQLLRAMGLEVVEVNCNVEDTFIARDTDTDDKAGLEQLKEVVKNEQCDFGIAFDGDGDRVVFVNEKGEFVQGEYSCSLVARETQSDTIVTPINSSQVVDQLGKKVIRTKVGSPQVIATMKANNALFGFEANGGAVSGEIMFTRDGGTMCMKMLNQFAKFDGTFSEMVDQLPKYYMFRSKVDYKWEQQETILQKAQEVFQGIDVETLDGLKIWIDKETWILFRSSQTAPEFRVFAESKDEQKARDLFERGISLVNNIING